MRLGRYEVRFWPFVLIGSVYALGHYAGARSSARVGDEPPLAPGDATELAQGRRRRGNRAAYLVGGLLLAGAVGAVVATNIRSSDAEAIGQALTGGNPARAPALLRRYGCGGCHTISALSGADGKVAAPLDAFAQRVFIGGIARNSPENLERWIVSPQSLSPRSAMPATGITPDEARDVAAFLYAH